MEKRSPLSATDRDYLYRRKQQGASHRAVAQELQCSIETVRKHWKAYRHGQARRARGRPARGILSQYPEAVRQQAIAIKQAHPHWGPANVRIELAHQLGCPVKNLPSKSRLTALFKQACPAAVQPRKPKVAAVRPPPSWEVQQRWQIDAVEKIRLADGQFATMLQIREPVSALIIASHAFDTTKTATTWRKLTLKEVQLVVREAMQHWGRPLEIQTDHEGVYAGAGQNDFPTQFTMWLAGLHIVHCFSRKGTPTDQSQMERSQRTLGDMSWKDGQFTTLADLQHALDISRQRYNEELPVNAGRCHDEIPLQKTPWAIHTGRPFDTSLEADLFDLLSVDHLLYGRVFTRKIDQNGVLWLGSSIYYFKPPFRSRVAQARFLPEKRSFEFATESGEVIDVQPAKGLCCEDLIGELPVGLPVPVPFQLPLPLRGV
jgi:transposase InsO family protein